MGSISLAIEGERERDLRWDFWSSSRDGVLDVVKLSIESTWWEGFNEMMKENHVHQNEPSTFLGWNVKVSDHSREKKSNNNKNVTPVTDEKDFVKNMIHAFSVYCNDLSRGEKKMKAHADCHHTPANCIAIAKANKGPYHENPTTPTCLLTPQQSSQKKKKKASHPPPLPCNGDSKHTQTAQQMKWITQAN